MIRHALLFLCFALAGCGGLEEATLIEGDDLSQSGEDELLAADLSNCGPTLSLAGVTASGAQDGNPATQAVDSNFATRWSQLGPNATLTLDFGAVKPLCAVGLAWYRGDLRRSSFALSLSSDGQTFTQVFSGSSTGTTTGLEPYSLGGKSARYLRLKVDGNTENLWSSVTEITVSGAPALQAKMRYSVSGSTVSFESISTGAIARTEWDLDATGPTTGVDFVGTRPPARTFALGTSTTPRSYAVKLTVIDAQGNRHSVYEPLSFGAAYLGPKSNPHINVEGLTLRAYGLGSTGSALTYEWNYGDGTTATGMTPPEKTYAAAGPYTLTLKVTDSQGRSHSQSRLLHLAPRHPLAPGAHNTGVKKGTKLTPVGIGQPLPPGMTLSGSGDVMVSGPLPAADSRGCTYSGLEFRGYVSIRTANVTICDSLFVGRRPNQAEDQNNEFSPRLLWVTSGAATNTKIKDSTFLPAFPIGSLDAVGGRNYTLERVDISGTADGLKVYANSNDSSGAQTRTAIRDSYIHDLRYESVSTWFLNRKNSAGFWRVEGNHSDGIQYQGGVGTEITGNTIVGAMNASLQVTQDYFSSGDVRFTGNHVDGGGCPVNVSNGGKARMTGFRIQNNVFGKNMRNQPGLTFSIAPHPVYGSWSTAQGPCGVIYTYGESDLDNDANISGNVWQAGGTLTRSPRVGLYRVGG